MTCPICHHTQNTQLLFLEDYPIYQHPMIDSSKIPLPHTVNLQYEICTECAHAYQSNYDRNILEKIYSYHYYTPSPDSIGATFRNEFIDFIKQQSIIKKDTAIVLEVGCSSGDTLWEIKSLYPRCDYRGIEPNEETAISAKKRGFKISTEFFTQAYAQKIRSKIDLIYSRHVIEHVFDFNDFFNAATKISNNETQLILETPSLDWAIEHTSTVAFHVEHIHVFSERSLITLANKFGWYKNKSKTTASGNLIVSFTRDDNNRQLPSFPHNLSGLQVKNKQVINDIHNICKNKKFIFWGAGSGAVTLLALSKLTPLQIIDGNPNKVGKYFCGIDIQINYAPKVVEELIVNNDDQNLVMVISSSFYKEIEQQLIQLGWRGEVYSPYKND